MHFPLLYEYLPCASLQSARSASRPCSFGVSDPGARRDRKLCDSGNCLIAWPQVSVQGNALMATPTAITFAFTPSIGFLQADFNSGGESIQFWNQGGFASPQFMYPNGVGTIFVCDTTSVCYSDSLYFGTQPIANFKAVSAPEIDPASLAGAVTLLFGLLAVSRGRRAETASGSA